MIVTLSRLFVRVPNDGQPHPLGCGHFTVNLEKATVTPCGTCSREGNCDTLWDVFRDAWRQNYESLKDKRLHDHISMNLKIIIHTFISIVQADGKFQFLFHAVRKQ